MPSLINHFLPERNLGTPGPLDPFWYGPFYKPPASRVRVTEDTSLTYAAVWACTKLLAGTEAWLPLNLYRHMPDGGHKLNRQHIAYKLTQISPNPRMSALMFRSQASMQQINWGGGFAEIERANNNKPLNLWPIHASRVKRMRDEETDGIVWEIRNNEGPPTHIPDEDMLHIPSIMSHNGVDGLGIIKFARESIGMGIATERYGAAHFGNSAIPTGIIKHPQKLSPVARTNLRQEWNIIHQQSENAGNIGILGEGADFTKLSFSAEDNQYLQTRQHNTEEICRWYGVPPHMVQHLLRSTYNNIEHQGIEFVIYSLMPWLAVWEHELTRKLLTENERENYYFRHNTNALMRGDAKTRAEYWRTLIQIGVIKPNEARVEEGFNPYEGGDEAFMQGAMVPVKQLLNPPEPPKQPEITPQNEAKPPKKQPKTPKNPENQGESMALQAISLQIHQMEGRMRIFASEAARNAVAGLAQPVEQDLGLKEAAVDLLEAATTKMLRLEANAARRAAAKPDKFLSWLDEFFDAKHVQTVAESVAPLEKPLRKLGFTFAAQAFASDWTKAAHTELLDASGNARTADDLTRLVDEWENKRLTTFTFAGAA